MITGCTIDCGDDNIAVKPKDARKPGNKNCTITKCSFLHGHGMSIGSGTNGGIEDLTVRDCTFDSTDSGIRIKTLRGRGGLLQNLTYENLTMTRVKNPIHIIDYYPEREAPQDPAIEQPREVTERTPINKSITIRHVTATGCTQRRHNSWSARGADWRRDTNRFQDFDEDRNEDLLRQRHSLRRFEDRGRTGQTR